MCEIPSNVILADEFAEVFDGFSIGSNDLTQLILGVDRDSEIVAHLFDERNPAVMTMIADVIAQRQARRAARSASAARRRATIPSSPGSSSSRASTASRSIPTRSCRTTLGILESGGRLGSGALLGGCKPEQAPPGEIFGRPLIPTMARDSNLGLAHSSRLRAGGEPSDPNPDILPRSLHQRNLLINKSELDKDTDFSLDFIVVKIRIFLIRSALAGGPTVSRDDATG